MRHPFSRRRSALAAVLLILTAVAPHGAEAADPQLPNLRPLLPAEDIIISWDDNFTTPDDPMKALRFASVAHNAGQYALDVLGVPPIDETRSVANQCVAWTDRVCTARQPAGELEFHAFHQHWHINNFAEYELRRLTKKGVPDLRPTGLVGTSGKVSFCLMDIDRQKESDITDPFNETGFYTTCTGLHQGISSGWADVYENGTIGQQILIDTVPDGDYALILKLNPLNQILETDYSDNTTYQKIRLGTDTCSESGRTVEVLP